MSFKDIINNFHLEYSKLNSNQNYSSLSYDLPGLELIYQNSIKSINEFDELYLSSCSQTISLLKGFENLIIKNNDKFHHDKENYDAIYRFNSDNISSDLKNKLTEIEQLNIALSDKEYLTTIKNRDVLNNIDINKNLTNLGFQSYDPDIHKDYNKMMVLFNKKRETDNNQSHAKTSKDIYILQEYTNKKIDEVTEQINNTEKSIKVIHDEISQRKKRKDDSILDEDIKFNELIDKITKKFNSEKNLNNIQSNIEIDSLNESLDQISEKYNSLRQKISTDLQEKFEIIDKQIDDVAKSYNKEINDFYSSYSIKRYQLEKDYNDTIYLNNELESNHIFSKKMNKYQEKKAKKVFFQYDKLMKKKEIEIKEAYRRNTNLLKNNKYVLDNDRKYKLALLEIDEKIERHQILNNIHYSNFEKKEYEKIIENNLSIEANKNRITSENLKLGFNIDFRRFELNLKSSLFQLERKLAVLKSHKKYLTSYLEQTIDSKQKIDANKKRLNDLTAVLSIEKYKNLVKYNQGLINSQIEKTNLLYSFEVNNAKNIYKKDKNILALNKELYAFSSEFYRKDASLLKHQETLEYKYNTTLLDENSYYNNEATKLNLKIKKLKLDYKVFDGLFACLENVLRSYTIYFTNNLKHLLSTSNQKENQTYINSLILLFKDLFEEFSKQANLLAKKLINDRICFNIGNEYDDIIAEAMKKYQAKEDEINNNLASLNETISRYKATIHSYYKDINYLKTKLDAVKNNLSNENIRIIKNEIALKNKKIDNISASIKNLEEQIRNIPQKQQINLDNKNKELAKINDLKEKDLEPYNQICNKLDSLFFKIGHEINYLSNICNYLGSSSNKISKILSKACSSINKSFSTISKSYKEIVSYFYSYELKVIEGIYKKVDRIHKNELINILRNHEKEKKELDRNIKNNNNLYLAKQLDIKDQISEVEKTYLNNYSINFNKKKESELKLIEKNNEHKNNYMAIFNACDANSFSIRDSLIKEIKSINKKYNQAIITLDEIKNIEIKDHEKIFKQNNINRKKHISIIPRYDKAERKKITDEYKIKNIKLDNENKQIIDNLKYKKKEYSDENESYRRLQYKEKIKLSKQYSISNKALRRKSNFN